MLRVLLFSAAVAALAGCAGPSEGMLTPLGTLETPGSRVDVLVATVRSSEGAKPGQMFTGERAERMAYADIAVSIPPDSARQIGEVQWPRRAPGDPAKDFVTLKADRIDKAEAARRFRARVAATPKRRALVFIHGYNTRFEDAVYRLAQFVHDSDAPVTPVLFTWPSRGKLLAYAYDRESASYSRDALESLLRSLANDPSVGDIAVLAHSMGNWVTLEALRQMAIRDKTLPRKLQSVMFAAPDVDVDVARLQIAQIETSKWRPSFTLFVSQDDDALAVSNRIAGGTARLGAIDPDEEPYKTELKNAHVNVIDLSDVKDGGSIGHTKFAESPEVVQMIGRRLAQGQALNDGKPGLGETVAGVAAGAAGFVGSAAGIAMAAPLAIVDPRSRDALGDSLEDMRSHTEQMVPLSHVRRGHNKPAVAAPAE